MKRVLIAVIAALALYAGAYLAYRHAHTEIWTEDGKAYVMFASRTGWYLFRPAGKVDAMATGMRFHLGAHRDSPRALLDRAIAQAGGATALEALRAFEWRGEADAVVAGSGTTGKPLHLSGVWRLQLPDSVIVTTTLAGQPSASARTMIIAGGRGWTLVDRRMTPLAPDLLAHERDQFYLYHLMRLVPLRSPAYRLSPLPDDSTGRRRIRAGHARRPDVDLTFDSTGALAGLADGATDPQTHRGVRQQVALAGRVEAAGVHWPRRIAITWDGAPYFTLEILELRSLDRLVDPLLNGTAPRSHSPAPVASKKRRTGRRRS